MSNERTNCEGYKGRVIIRWNAAPAGVNHDRPRKTGTHAKTKIENALRMGNIQIEVMLKKKGGKKKEQADADNLANCSWGIIVIGRIFPRPSAHY